MIVINESAHEILVPISNAQKTPLKAHGDGSRGARGLIFDPSHFLLPYFVYVRCESSGETLHIHRLI